MKQGTQPYTTPRMETYELKGVRLMSFSFDDEREQGRTDFINEGAESEGM